MRRHAYPSRLSLLTYSAHRHRQRAAVPRQLLHPDAAIAHCPGDRADRAVRWSSATPTELSGWTQPELLAVMGVYILMGGVIQPAIQPNMQRLMDEIQQGTLDLP